MKVVHHDPVVDLTVIVDKIGFKWYEESTVPIRVDQGDLAQSCLLRQSLPERERGRERPSLRLRSSVNSGRL